MSSRGHKVSIVGAGKVGTATGVLLSRAGYEIVAVSAPRLEQAEESARFTGGRPTVDNTDAARQANLIFITTPDDAIGEVCAEIAGGEGFNPGDFVFHMSGAASNDVLEPAKAAGAHIGSIHPMQSFADVRGAIETMSGSVFGVTAAAEAMPAARELVEALGGTMVAVAPDQKTLYHAAACVVSNYFVALTDYAEDIYEHIGVDPGTARRAYIPLVAGTQANVARRGPTDALTGPIARGDVGTVRDHLAAMSEAGLDDLIYRLLGMRATQIAVRRGSIDETTASSLLEMLSDTKAGETRRKAEG